LSAACPTSNLPQEPARHAVAVLGASPKPERYANQAIRLLKEKGYRVLPVHPKFGRIEELPVFAELAAIEEQVHTLTLYVGPERSQPLIPEILALRPGRVIFNPGTESAELEAQLTARQIPCIHGCTLVMLKTRQF
jgi:uncharacterized protein